MAEAKVATLFDSPGSNHGARIRMILYYKQIGTDEVSIASPTDLGGLKAPAYLELNPHGKMPCLVTSEPKEAIPESDTIARFLCAKFADRAPELMPSEPMAAMRCDRITRHHDVYIAAVQGSLYKVAGSVGPSIFPPFGNFGSRAEAIAELVKQIGALEALVDNDGPFLLGAQVSGADCAVFPTMALIEYMLPKFGQASPMGPKLAKWWAHMCGGDEVAMRVKGEIDGSLAEWDKLNRWNPILGAGTKDTDPPTIFDKILAKQIPSTVVWEDDRVLAFRDIAPVAPTHVLIIPKVRAGLTQLQHATAEHKMILGHMLSVAVPAVAAKEGLRSYRLVINDGERACQTVFHLHMHIIGGKQLSWPPGTGSNF